MADKSTQWSGRMGFILASLGMAFGAGNIWRFPRVVAENDGGAFLIAFIVANLIWTVPLLMIEMIMGKTTRLGTVGAFRDFVGPGKTWMGAWIGMCCVLIMFYYSVLDCAFELSSMGIRVDSRSLAEQLAKAGCEERAQLPFHRALLDGTLPLSIGGGIGQSRMCMMILGKAHIGEVQSSLWDRATIEASQKSGVTLL